MKKLLALYCVLALSLSLASCEQKETREWEIGKPLETTEETSNALENDKDTSEATSPKAKQQFTIAEKAARHTAVIPPDTRIVSLSAAATEFLARLGYGQLLVARDLGSSYPPSIAQVPKMGPAPSVGFEELMKHDPDLVIGLKRELNPALVKALQALPKDSLTLITLELAPSYESLLGLYEQLGEKLDLRPEADSVRQVLEQGLAAIPKPTVKKKALFVYAAGKERLAVAGKNTAIDALFGFAHIENAFTETGYQAFKPEMLYKLQPDALVFFEQGLASVGGMDGLVGLPGFASSEAVRQGRVYAFDAYYLTGFGLRTHLAAQALHDKLYKNPLP